MFDNSMIGAVGFAMHEDRLATATQNLRLTEAEAATRRQRVPLVGERYRVAMAKRIVPSIAVPNASTPALAQ